MHPPITKDPLAGPFDFFEDDGGDRDAATTLHELSLTRSKLGNLLDLLPAGLLIHQEQGIVYANQEAARILGLPMDALIGRHVLDFVTAPDADALANRFRACLRERRPVRAHDCALVGADGGHSGVQVSMSPLPWEGLPVIYVLITDVTAMRETQDRLHHLSITDPLTGAHNRRYFIDAAEQEIARARRAGRPVALLALDIDHFKRINDTHGHAVGDDALRAFTATCRTGLRAGDVFGRLGGEEFAVFLPDTDAAAACAVAERLRAGTAATVVPAGAAELRFTVSIGVAACAHAEGTVDTLLSRADRALYGAKAAGRNRVAVADAIADARPVP
ncbi:GGDEF domain-containing protein [Azospirillum halopraeferens]|uniref:GGDEF domain-containing protein n=1 Tax=Azospirillum halopraeferens TaxID=34010 RepID=UPI000686D76E|nr:sensor domain-containing diguanylate cyclase [Azospirillum halopraeferens]